MNPEEILENYKRFSQEHNGGTNFDNNAWGLGKCKLLVKDRFSYAM